MVFAKRRKYGNVKTEVDGHKFDSKKEAKRYGELKELLKAGKIERLVIHPRFILQEAFRDERVGKRKDGTPGTVRQIAYTADFKYHENGRVVVEDVKSPASKTTSYVIRKALFLKRYPSVDFREI